MDKFITFYTRKGWQIFPCRPNDKTPSVKWADVATSDHGKAAEIFAQHPGANIGIATGARSGIVVLDVDAGHGGMETIAELEARNGALPRTPRAVTGGGGRHYLFSHPGIEIHNSAGKVGKGLDIRGDGGYIVAPPSVHPNGNLYQWEAGYKPSECELAPAPQWLIELATARQELNYPQSQPQPQAQSAPQGDAIPNGSRNQAMISLAGTMRRRGMSEAAIYNALLAENKAKCVPPLPESEISAIVKSATRYQPSAPVATANAERLNMEWCFAKVMFDFPPIADDFHWLEPALFSDPSLADFWARLRDGQTATRAADEAHIIGEIERIKANADLVDFYANGITRHEHLAGIAKLGRDIEFLACQGDMERLQATITALAEIKPQSPAVAVASANDGLDELAKSMKEGRRFVKTGLGNFDAITGGLELKTVSVLGARPSMGKTTVAWQGGRSIALNGQRVLFLSLEVSAVSLWRKAAFGLAEISNADFENGKVPQNIIDRVINEIIPNLKRVLDGKMFIYDTPPFTSSALEKAIAQTKPDVIILDHLDYVELEAENQTTRLGKIMKWAKRCAKKYNAHFMVLHQLNRDVEKRDRKEPQLADLRDSGNVEQDADMVIMPYRPSYYAENSFMMRYHETMLYIRKNRDGRLGTVGLYMDMLHQWFYRRDEVPNDWANIKLGAAPAHRGE